MPTKQGCDDGLLPIWFVALIYTAMSVEVRTDDVKKLDVWLYIQTPSWQEEAAEIVIESQTVNGDVVFLV